MAIKRTIVIGDIHGCIDEFNELLKELSYDDKSDELILLGDLIDRGPDSVAVVRKARQMNLKCVRGNHEHKFVKWLNSQNSRVNVYTGLPHYKEFSDEDINYIIQMPYYLIRGDFLIVHAGLRPGVSLEKQKKDDFMYIRYMEEDGSFVSLKTINKVGKEAAGAHFWTETYDGSMNVVYGHNVHSYDEPRIDTFPDKGTACYGIDTGACFGGKLTAMILETKEIVQIKSKKVYYASSFEIR